MVMVPLFGTFGGPERFLFVFPRSEMGGSETNDDVDNDRGVGGLTAQKMNTHMETDISTTNLRRLERVRVRE